MKIIDITAGNITPKEVQELREATAKEIDILRKVSGHPNVSELGSGRWGEGSSAPFILQGVPRNQTSTSPIVLAGHRTPALSSLCSTFAHTCQQCPGHPGYLPPALPLKTLTKITSLI